MGPSGLDRIRQQFPSRVMTLPNISASSLVPSNSNSQHRSPSPRSSSTSRAHSSRAMSFESSATLENLHRFPCESLHSFSFAQQPEELLHSRQNILKRSIDFMRGRFGRSVSGAQTGTCRDTEGQCTVDSFMSQPDILGKSEGYSDTAGLALGPMTGPPDVSGNIFEKAFMDYGNPPEATQSHAANHRVTPEVNHPLSPLPKDHISHQKSDPKADDPLSRHVKRTYTDGSSAGPQSKLMETLAQSTTDPMSASVGSSSLGLGFPVPALHTHSSKWNPVSQAVFRTDAQAPWTILAANDLSCLVFGVTQAELRKLSILEVVQKDRRQWLESKLGDPSTDAAANFRSSSPTSSDRTRISQVNSKFVGSGNGSTAKLFSKPPSSRGVRRSQTDNGFGSSTRTPRDPYHPATKSRGVLLCGDVVPIRKRNGTQGSASIWVMEKRGGLIWVLEEITENTAYVDCDSSWNITTAQGDTEKIWGPEVVQPGKRITELLPRLPQEYLQAATNQAMGKIFELKYFAARNAAGFCSPVTVEKTDNSAQRRLRVSSFPHVAGMMVLSASTLKVISSNSVFSAALFGQERPEGLHVTNLLPGFDRLLDVLNEEDDGPLMDGMVIPEQSLRRARTLAALRDEKTNVASVFLEPAGLTASHRDGSIMAVDVQLRVVKSETIFSRDEQEKKVNQHDDGDDYDAKSDDTVAATELLYALWVTYSRQVHSIGPASSLRSSKEASRNTTPVVVPGPTAATTTQPEPSGTSEKPSVKTQLPSSTLSQQLHEAASEPLNDKPVQPVIEVKSNISATKDIPEKRSIADYVILEEMGQGAYGEVKLTCLKKNPSKRVVLKYVTKKRILVDTWTRDRKLGTVPLEIHVLDFLRRDGLRHPNIVEMEGFFEDDVNYYIEMKPHGLPGMDLFDYIELKANMDETECRNIFRQVVDAIHHLHIKARVVHRDIKDENVILDGEGRIKLIDFGSAAYIKNGPFDVFVGTIDYAAPEVLQGKSYGGKEQDVWALGILLYTIVYKENPFYNIDEILDHPLRIPYLPFSEDCIDLIRKMLDRDVDNRYTITEVMEHPWMASG